MRRLNIKSALLSAVVGLVLGFATPHAMASAHDIGWRWDRGFGAYAIFENRTLSYGAYVAASGIDYNNNTHMHVDSCADNGQCGWIVFLQGDYGNTGWYAGTVPYHDLNPCVTWPDLNSNGNCDSLFRKANFAYIYANNNPGPLPAPDWLLRHEAGHAFGLAHSGCAVWSVMRVALCGSGPLTLQTHDIQDINGMY